MMIIATLTIAAMVVERTKGVGNARGKKRKKSIRRKERKYNE